ncbi:MAG: hypothetical protein Q9173_006587 [Seirophora scorigena]
MASDDSTARASLMREPESPSDSFEALSGSFVSEETQSASPSIFIWALSVAAGISGILFGYDILFITGGQVIAYVLGYVLAQRLHGWRWMVGLGAVPAVVQFVLLLKLPETPRWLVKAGKEDVARVVLKKVYASKTNTAPEQVLKEIRREIMEEQATSKLVNPVTPGNDGWPSLTQFQNRMTELLFVGGNRRALTIACMVQALQQLCGFNSIMYFSATIFSLLGFASPILTSLWVAVTNFACTLVALLIIDRVGRRAILLRSVPVMIGGLVLCSVSYHFLGLPIKEPKLLEQIHISGHSPWATCILVSLVIFVCGYAIGPGNIAWQQSELFPLSVRSLGSGLATATNS